VHRQRRQTERALRACVVCGGPQEHGLFESWQPHGVLRRRGQVAWRWVCLRCGTRTTVRAPG
jgi:hypothetical protein